MKKTSKKMGRPTVSAYKKADRSIKISTREIESLERITGLKHTKALRSVLHDFIMRNGGYCDEQSK
jgi:hypothetical protein